MGFIVFILVFFLFNFLMIVLLKFWGVLIIKCLKGLYLMLFFFLMMILGCEMLNLNSLWRKFLVKIVICNFLCLFILNLSLFIFLYFIVILVCIFFKSLFFNLLVVICFSFNLVKGELLIVKYMFIVGSFKCMGFKGMGLVGLMMLLFIFIVLNLVIVIILFV